MQAMEPEANRQGQRVHASNMHSTRVLLPAMEVLQVTSQLQVKSQLQITSQLQVSSQPDHAASGGRRGYGGKAGSTWMSVMSRLVEGPTPGGRRLPRRLCPTRRCARA
jgi:hypothetical protein